MIDRMVAGQVPDKPHTALRDPEGQPAPRRVPDARRVRRAVHDPVPPGPPARRDARGRRPRLGDRVQRGRRAAAAGAAALPVARAGPARRRRPGRAHAAAVQRRRRPVDPAPRRAGSRLLRERRRGRPVLHPRGGRRAALVAGRRRLPGARLRVRAARPHPSLHPQRRPAILAVDRVPGRGRRPAAVSQRGGAAAHGRALHAPRLSPPVVRGPARRGAARSGRQARRRVPRLPLPARAAGRGRVGTAPSIPGRSPSWRFSRASA